MLERKTDQEGVCVEGGALWGKTDKARILERRPVDSKTRAACLYGTRVSYSTCWTCDPLLFLNSPRMASWCRNM